MRSPRLALSLVALMLLLAPVVQAQPTPVGSDTTVSFTLPQTVGPGTQLDTAVNVTYSWEDGALTNEDTQVNLNFSVAFSPLSPWAQISLGTDTLTFTPGPQAGSQTKQVNLSVAMDSDAPAYIPATITISAQAQQNGAISGSQGQASRDLYATYQPAVRVDAPATATLDGDSGTLEIPVQNQGNGPVRVWITDVEAGSDVTAEPGDPVVLGPGGQAAQHAPHLSVGNDLKQRLQNPRNGTVTMSVSGSGTLSFSVAYGPTEGGNSGTPAATQRSSVQVQGGGGLLLPLLALAAIGAAAGGGYLLLADREEEPEMVREPVLVPVDEEVEEYDGEEWIEVEEEGEAWVFDDLEEE